MFSEDVGLLPQDSFKSLLQRYVGKADKFHIMAKVLWDDMNQGEYSTALEVDILRFNGGRFANAEAMLLNEEQLLMLINAARATGGTWNRRSSAPCWSGPWSRERGTNWGPLYAARIR